MIKRTALLLAACALIPVCASGQQQNDLDVVDRLVAIVGDSVVVLTQVQEEIQRMSLGGAPVPEPTDPAYRELFDTVLEQYVDRLLILQAAAKDSLLTVDEAAIEETVTARIQQLSSEFGGQQKLQQALASEALTLSEYREILRTEARTERVQQMFFQSRIANSAPAEVTEDELQERFQEARSELEQRPKLLTFRQVVVVPESSDDAMARARTEAEGIMERVTAGEDFAELARLYSDDPGTAALGGDLGWFRRGRMVKEFEDAAFSLIDDQVSEIVETDFGYHIIKVERYRAGERQARHILIVPEKSPEDIQRARELVIDLMARAQAGEQIADLAEEYGDPAAPDSMTFAFEQLNELPPAYAILRTTPANDYRGPMEYQLPTGEQRVAFIHVVEVREAGAYTFDDLRGQLAGQLQQEKQIEQMLETLRSNTYIDIRM